ncbi:MAG: hypothetical protein IJ191_06785 [Treponema sp.]|nr:hypothetical protein [Treponema sp.]
MNFKKCLLHCVLGTLVAAAFPENGVFPVVHSGVLHDFSYYGFPLRYSVGYNYRKNDFSLFAPYVGLRFDARQNSELHAIGGIRVQYKTFFAQTQFVGELWNSNARPFSSTTEYGLDTVIGSTVPNGSIAAVVQYGKKRWNHSGSKEALWTLSPGLTYDFYIIDTVLFKATGTAAVTFHIVPQKSFSAYNVQLSVPFQFNWLYGESCFLYSLFYADYLSRPQYDIQKTYTVVSGRFGLTAYQDTYAFLTAFETEQRLYPARWFNVPSSFFLSLFGNIALGFNNGTGSAFLYQYGVGIGYNLYNCVPFTFQFGFDHRNIPIFYLGIVSKITHRP